MPAQRYYTTKEKDHSGIAMEFVHGFINYLLLQNKKPAQSTLKNYKADIRQFISWYEITHQHVFNPVTITPEIIGVYKKYKTQQDVKNDSQTPNDQNIALEYHTISFPVSNRSLKRHMVSLRRFFAYLKDTHRITSNPAIVIKQTKDTYSDTWQIHGFKDALYLQKASYLTIKNYILDIQKFVAWADTRGISFDKPVNMTTMVAAYKEALNHKDQLSQSSIKRRLSSLRKYIQWRNRDSEYLNDIVNTCIDTQSDTLPVLAPQESISSILFEDANNTEIGTQSQPVLGEMTYSKIPPIRLFQKISSMSNQLFDHLITVHLAKLTKKAQYLLWKTKGNHVFEQENYIQESVLQQFAQAGIHPSYEKSLLPTKKHRWLHSAHSHPFIRLVLLGTTIFLISFLTSHVLDPTLLFPTNTVLGEKTASPSRVFSFRGRLADKRNVPLTTQQQVRFRLYNTNTEKTPLWEEANTVQPDNEGIFTVLLGNKITLPAALVSNNAAIWLGITIGQDQELTPRQQIPTSSYAANADFLGGLLPITQPGAGDKNTILALDSSGNLSINGKRNHRFQATGGEFSLAGETLLLTTLPGSDGDITLSPDGIGKIDVQKPLYNSTDDSGVLIEDSLSISASSSASQSAIAITQEGQGSLISAFSKGSAKFLVDTNGIGTFFGGVHIGDIASPAASLDVLGAIRQTSDDFASGIILQSETLASSRSPSLEFKDNQAQAKSVFLRKIDNSFHVLDSDASSLFQIGLGTSPSSSLTAGNFGIGTTTPATALHVSGITPTMTLENTRTQTGDQMDIVFKNSVSMANSKISSILETGGQTAKLQIATGGQNPTIALTIDSQGKIGVGISTPTKGPLEFASGAFVTSGGVFTNASDRNKKTNVTPLDPKAILGKLRELPITQWNYKNEDAIVKHIGPSAQDFYSLFGLGGSDTSISTIDPSGIALLAIQALDSQVQALDKQTTKLSATLNQEKTDAVNTQNFGQVSVAATAETPSIYTLYNTFGQLITRIGTFARITAGNIKTGGIVTKELVTDSLTVTSQNITIAGVSMQEYITQTVKASITQNQLTQKETISPLVKSDQIYAGILSPLPDKKDLFIQLPNTASEAGKLIVQNTQGKTTSSIDSQGNATFSGTLRAQKIIADEIDLPASLREALQLEERNLATQSAQYTTNITNIYQASASSELTQTPISEPLKSQLVTTLEPETLLSKDFFVDVTKMASFSAQLASAGILHADFGSFDLGLVALGGTSLADTTITGQLSIGNQLKINETSINVLSSDLELQSLRQGGISILGGQIRIDIEGNLKALGNASFAKDLAVGGTLSANIISPLPNNDLTIKLTSETENDSENPHLNPRQSSFHIQNASGSAVLSANSLGDLIASGTATIKKLQFSLVQPALAVGDAEVLASSSAGTTIVKRNQTEVTVRNQLVSERSLIYITPVGTPSGQTPFLLRQVAQESFSVGVPSQTPLDTYFNWLIVN